MKRPFLWIPAVCVAVLAIVAAESAWLSWVQRPVSDALQRWVGRVAPPAAVAPDVVIVTIDPQSLREVSQEWPWSRALFADVVQKLHRAGAASIAFDIDFSTARDPYTDSLFADAMRESQHVVLSAHRQFQHIAGVGDLEVASFPAAVLQDAAAAIGSVLVEIDADSVVRRGFRARELAGTRVPSMPLAALSVALGESLDRSDLDDAFPIDYRRAYPPVPAIAISDVLEGRFDPEIFVDRVVLIGATAVEFQDLWATPIGPSRPGVYIQALALRTLAAERVGAAVLTPPIRSARWAGLIAVSLLAGALSGAGPWRRGAGLGALGVGVLAVSAAGFAGPGWHIDPVVPTASILVHYALGLEVLRRRFGLKLAESETSLSTLLSVGEVTTTGGDARDQSLNIALALLGDVVGASGVVLLRTEEDGELATDRLEWNRGDTTEVDTGIAGDVLRCHRSREVTPDGGGRAVYTPLFAGDHPIGVLVVARPDPESLDATQMRTIATVGTQLALSVENLQLIENLRATFNASVEAIASAVEARDGYTEMHCRRLAAFSVTMAERLGFEADEVEAIRLGALLHDVGKIGIRDDVLLKEGRLTAEDRAEIERHPEIGRHIVEPIPGLGATTIACVYHHHERWDGAGYPDGLSGEEIPTAARIVALVDVWDALSTARPYKAAYPQDRVRDLLEKDSGVRFDPALVELFFRVLDEEGEEMLALIERTSR